MKWVNVHSSDCVKHVCVCVSVFDLYIFVFEPLVTKKESTAVASSHRRKWYKHDSTQFTFKNVSLCRVCRFPSCSVCLFYISLSLCRSSLSLFGCLGVSVRRTVLYYIAYQCYLHFYYQQQQTHSFLVGDGDDEWLTFCCTQRVTLYTLYIWRDRRSTQSFLLLSLAILYLYFPHTFCCFRCCCCNCCSCSAASRIGDSHDTVD